VEEVRKRGWDELDIIIVSGDAYVDHPAFGAAVIGRILEKQGYRIAILPQPNWRDDLRDFRKLGKPRLFFGVTSGAMDSMVNHYTAQKRLRHDDAYTAGGVYGFRPDYATTVYARILKQIYPSTPVVLGGIEASLRRITHYDYWSDTLKPSILAESGADYLVYGMGEHTIVELARFIEQRLGVEIDSGRSVQNLQALFNIQQIAFIMDSDTAAATIAEIRHCEQTQTVSKARREAIPDTHLASHEECLKDKCIQAENFVKFETASNQIYPPRLLQRAGDKIVIINPPRVPAAQDIDSAFDLPYTREPHPRYKKRGEIPAYKMIRNSVNIHRGCFGGCAFCTISAHQGKHVQSRSEKSIINEIKQIVEHPDFKGVLSDLGGPSANMYAMGGKENRLCERCNKSSCIYPKVCNNLNVDYKPLVELYKKVTSLPQIKKCFIGSGVRYDMLVQYLQTDSPAREYAELLIDKATSGRLKVAPEHTEDHVLKLMRKSSFSTFENFKKFFDNRAKGTKQLVPYFIASHPGCTMQDMKALTRKTRAMGYKLEQVQNFTPTPLTLATEMYHTGLNPYTMEKVYVPGSKDERARQIDELLR
jgi:uncharacterized radical SAM protein YgiQ